MVGDVFQELNELLLKKINCLNDLYSFSKDSDFKGEEDEVEKFENYIEQRQNIIDSCIDLDNKYNEIIESMNISELQKDDRYKEIDNNRIEISNLSKKILAIDKDVNSKMDKLLNHVKKELHQINVSKVVNKRYNNLSSEAAPSYFFDKKN